MLRSKSFWCLLLVFFNICSGLVERFLYRDNAPRCCDEGEVLMGSDISKLSYTDCVPDDNGISYILTYEPSLDLEWYNSSADNYCINDILDSESETRSVGKIYVNKSRNTNLFLSYFPKCCPPYFAYNAFEHKCEFIENGTFRSFDNEFLYGNLLNGFFYIKPGLSDCNTVIADYQLHSIDSSLIDDENAFYMESLNKSFPYGSYCIDKVYNSNNYVIRICHASLEICKQNKNDNEKIKCVRKCCPDGSIYKYGAKCRHDFENGLTFDNNSNKIKNYNEPFAIIQGHNCIQYLATHKFTLDEIGNIKFNVNGISHFYSVFEQSYCFEQLDDYLYSILFLCDRSGGLAIDFQINCVILLISPIFFILSMFYVFMTKKKTVQSQTEITYCISWFTSSVILIVLKLLSLEGDWCKEGGYILMYSGLMTFMWTHVLSFDMWRSIGSMRIQGIHQKKKEFRRFLWYCLYAFSVPAVITLSAFTMQEFGDNVPEYLQPLVPHLGGYNCFFEQTTNTVAFLIWFLLPIALIVLCNLVLYIKTVRYWYQVKREIEHMKDTGPQKKERSKILSADRKRLNMAVKLFLIMGISWLFESISVCAIPVPATGAAQVIQIIFDTFNSLQGVFIFCIFILKSKFLHAIQKRIGLKYLRRSSQSTSSAITASTYLVNSSASRK